MGPGQRLGLPVDEDMPDTVRLDPALRPETHATQEIK